MALEAWGMGKSAVWLTPPTGNKPMSFTKSRVSSVARLPGRPSPRDGTMDTSVTVAFLPHEKFQRRCEDVSAPEDDRSVVVRHCLFQKTSEAKETGMAQQHLWFLVDGADTVLPHPNEDVQQWLKRLEAPRKIMP